MSIFATFSKYRDLKFKIYLKFANSVPSLIQRTIATKKILNSVWFSIFVYPQRGKIGFALGEGKHQFILVYLQILLLTVKEQILLRCNLLKMFKTKNFSEALHPKSRQLQKVIFWNWGPTTIFWPNLASAQFYLQQSLTPFCL